MNINLTLFGQMIAFGIFVWFCFKYVWPPLTDAMEQRRQRIAKGLQDAVEAEKSLHKAAEQSEVELVAARKTAAQILERANKRGTVIVDEARVKAREEGERILAGARAEIERETKQARESLRASLSKLVVEGSEVVLANEVKQAPQDLIDRLASRL